MLIVALSLYSVGALTAALAPSFEWLVIGRILQGLSAGAGMIVGQAIVNLLATLPVSVIWLDPRDDVWPAIVPLLK